MQVADSIKCRGMHFKLAANIQAFLNHALAVNADRRHARATVHSVLHELVEAVTSGDSAKRLDSGLLHGAAAVASARSPRHLALAYKDEDPLDLEWMRDLPDEEARDFLMGISGA